MAAPNFATTAVEGKGTNAGGSETRYAHNKIVRIKSDFRERREGEMEW